MRLYPPWAVLAPGEPAWLEERARAALGLDEDEEDFGIVVESSFKIAPGGSHYHLLFSMDATSVGDEMLIAKHLSRECTEPVYAILEGSESALVFMYRNGVSETLEVEPEDLAQSLGCPFPEAEEPPAQEARRPLRRAALVEGVLAQEALRILEEEAGHPLAPGRYRVEDTPRGFIITGGSGTGGLGFADITLSERLPHATVYGVTATPSLDMFFVSTMQGGEGIGQFAQPPDYRDPLEPPVTEIKGERTPERILAALGIPAEWFRP
jgi:hypothetical protein